MKVKFLNEDKTKSVIVDAIVKDGKITLLGDEYYYSNRLYWNNQWLFQQYDVLFETSTIAGKCNLIHHKSGIGGPNNGYHIIFKIE